MALGRVTAGPGRRSLVTATFAPAAPPPVAMGWRTKIPGVDPEKDIGLANSAAQHARQHIAVRVDHHINPT